MPALLIISAVLLIGTVVALIVLNLKRSEMAKYYTAAGNTLREEYLNYSLQNNIGNESEEMPHGIKKMVCVKVNSNKKKMQYVFNPEKTILIGRDKHESNIYLHDNVVSKKHCCIYLHNGQVCLEDLNSANGTLVKRGLFNKYKVYGNNRIYLKTGDCIVIGASTFKVIMFNYDLSTM